MVQSLYHRVVITQRHVVLRAFTLALFWPMCFSHAQQQPLNEYTNNTHYEVQIARMMFHPNAVNLWDPGRPWWSIDWPEAEFHFTSGVSRYTRINIAPDSRHINLTDDAVFDHPWLFAQQVGRWQLTENEKQNLKEYLLRGGFLIVDDFHGPSQWRTFSAVFEDILGDYNIVDLDSTHTLMNVLFEIDQGQQIPGRRHLQGYADRIEVVMPHTPSRWRGIHDTDGRLMVAINFNMDMGDAWEHADDPVYPLAMTSFAYQLGINYLLYALTH